MELLDATLFFLKGRFDPLLDSQILTWMRDSLEHRLWPPLGDAALDTWGDKALTEFCNHISGLYCMKNFDLTEALRQWARLKKEMIGTQCYKKPFRKFWEHISQFYDNYIGYFMVLIPIWVSLLILADTSCNERGISEYNRIHTASRSSLTVSKVRDLFSIKHFGPRTSADFKPENLYES